MLGTTTGHAAAELETAELLEFLPATRAARDTGAISDLQAREIAGAATTALQARGMTCAVPGCSTTTRRTHLDQLDWLCHHHHSLKTNHSYRLQGPPGARTWHPPDQPAPDG